MKASREKVIKDLKILRHLLELLPMTGDLRVFDDTHIGEFLREFPFHLTFVMVTFCKIYKERDSHIEDERRALSLLADACTFVAPKEEEQFRYWESALLKRKMIACEHTMYYSIITLPRLLKMIDLALKDDDE